MRSRTRSSVEAALYATITIPIRGSTGATLPAALVGADLRQRTRRTRGVLAQTGRKAEADRAVTGIDDDLTRAEMGMRGHLVGSQHRRDGRARACECVDRVVTRSRR